MKIILGGKEMIPNIYIFPGKHLILLTVTLKH